MCMWLSFAFISTVEWTAEYTVMLRLCMQTGTLTHSCVMLRLNVHVEQSVKKKLLVLVNKDLPASQLLPYLQKQLNLKSFCLRIWAHDTGHLYELVGHLPVSYYVKERDIVKLLPLSLSEDSVPSTHTAPLLFSVSCDVVLYVCVYSSL